MLNPDFTKCNVSCHSHLPVLQGIIRRVTDSVTGLFSASWLSGWMGGEEEEESADPQPGPSQASTLAPPGESFIFAHPVTARKSFRPFYPEEGKKYQSPKYF